MGIRWVSDYLMRSKWPLCDLRIYFAEAWGTWGIAFHYICVRGVFSLSVLFWYLSHFQQRNSIVLLSYCWCMCSQQLMKLEIAVKMSLMFVVSCFHNKYNLHEVSSMSSKTDREFPEFTPRTFTESCARHFTNVHLLRRTCGSLFLHIFVDIHASSNS